MNAQNAIEYAKDKAHVNNTSIINANVLAIQIQGVRIINGKIPMEVRKILNEAVKNRQLGHLKKDGLLPECYHHINGRARAIEERNRIAYGSIDAIKKIAGYNKELI
jgi:hypothetical protein